MGEIFADVRGGDRTMRISYHSDRDVVVVSLWLDELCRASFRLASGDVDRFTTALLAMRSAPADPPADSPDFPEPDQDPPAPSEGAEATGAVAVLVGQGAG